MKVHKFKRGYIARHRNPEADRAATRRILRELKETREDLELALAQHAQRGLTEARFDAEWEQMPAVGREWPNEGCDQPPGIARQVSVTPDIMSGMPCFVGTRVPIHGVLGSLDMGMGLDVARKRYAFFTSEPVAAERAYAATHPRGLPSQPSNPVARARIGKHGKSA